MSITVVVALSELQANTWLDKYVSPTNREYFKTVLHPAKLSELSYSEVIRLPGVADDLFFSAVEGRKP